MNSKYFKGAFIFLCLGFIVLSIKSCNDFFQDKKESTKSDTVIINKTVSGKAVIKEIPQPYEIITPITIYDTIHDTTIYHIPMEIDTFRIIVDFYSKKKYKVPYSDSMIHINTEIEISENKIKSVEFEYSFNQTNTVITNTKTVIPKWNIAVGLGTSYSIKSKTAGININAGIDYKKNRVILGYDPFNNSGGIGYQYKIVNF
jgi:hypothetical protein